MPSSCWGLPFLMTVRRRWSNWSTCRGAGSAVATETYTIDALRKGVEAIYQLPQPSILRFYFQPSCILRVEVRLFRLPLCARADPPSCLKAWGEAADTTVRHWAGQCPPGGGDKKIKIICHTVAAEEYSPHR